MPCSTHSIPFNDVGVITVQNGYLNYNDMSEADAGLFMNAKLHCYLNEARAKLFRKSRGKTNYYKKTDDFNHNAKHLLRINSVIEYALILIGRYSNARYGKSAVEQHNFFKSPNEQGHFLTYLFMAVQENKNRNIDTKNSSGQQEILVPYLRKAHLKLRAFEKKDENYFDACEQKINEKQLYAAGVFYVMNFAFDALKIGSKARYEALLVNLEHFRNGPSYLSADGKKGAQKSISTKRIRKDMGYQIFCERIYKHPDQKRLAMALDLHAELKKIGIKMHISTVEKKWIQDFCKKIQNLKIGQI